MSKYIDADSLLTRIKAYRPYQYLGEDALSYSIKMVELEPSADVVEVVRCKDCIHNHIKSWNQGKRDNPSCHFTDLIRSNEFYCGFGERAEE